MELVLEATSSMGCFFKALSITFDCQISFCVEQGTIGNKTFSRGSNNSLCCVFER